MDAKWFQKGIIKNCIDCGIDISHRSTKTERCCKCATNRNRKLSAEINRKNKNSIKILTSKKEVSINYANTNENIYII